VLVLRGNFRGGERKRLQSDSRGTTYASLTKNLTAKSGGKEAPTLSVKGGGKGFQKEGKLSQHKRTNRGGLGRVLPVHEKENREESFFHYHKKDASNRKERSVLCVVNLGDPGPATWGSKL